MIQCRRSLGGGVESSAASLVVRWDDGHLTELNCFSTFCFDAVCGAITSHPAGFLLTAAVPHKDSITRSGVWWVLGWLDAEKTMFTKGGGLVEVNLASIVSLAALGALLKIQDSVAVVCALLFCRCTFVERRLRAGRQLRCRRGTKPPGHRPGAFASASRPRRHRAARESCGHSQLAKSISIYFYAPRVRVA